MTHLNKLSIKNNEKYSLTAESQECVGLPYPQTNLLSSNTEPHKLWPCAMGRDGQC